MASIAATSEPAFAEKNRLLRILGVPFGIEVINGVPRSAFPEREKYRPVVLET